MPPLHAAQRVPVQTRMLGWSLLAALLVGCGVTTGSPTLSASTAPAATAGSSAPLATPGQIDPEDTAGPTWVSQTDTLWGLIWDVLPTGFPAYPGAHPAEPSGEPASAILDVGDVDPAVVATFYQAALERAGYSTVALSGPHEDGSRELESIADAGCQIRTTVTPLDGTTIVTILFGAFCPYG